MHCNLTLRKISAFGLLICVGVIAAAYYIEYKYLVLACPLCMLQRIVFAALALLFLIGTVFTISGVVGYIYSSIVLLFALLGVFLSGRQVWLQYFAPQQNLSCAASLERLMDLYPVLDALKIALSGSKECSTVDFTIFGLSIAVWSVLLFSGMALGAIYIIYSKPFGFSREAKKRAPAMYK